MQQQKNKSAAFEKHVPFQPSADCFFFRARTRPGHPLSLCTRGAARSSLNRQPLFKFSPSLLCFERNRRPRWRGRANPVPPPRLSLIPASKLSLETTK